MPAHIRGCDAKSARSVDRGKTRSEITSAETHPAEEDALPRITALTQPYMFTIAAKAGQCGKATVSGSVWIFLSVTQGVKIQTDPLLGNLE